MTDRTNTRIDATDVTEEEAQNAVFFDRADQFIKLANEFCRPSKGQKTNPTEVRGQVGAAMLFSAARFNTEMRDAKDQIMAYLVQQFQSMLEDNYDEYCEQFENYLRYRNMEEFHQNKNKS